MSPANQALRATAAKWFARMLHAAPDDPARGKFEQWLTQDHAHAQAYQSIAQVWDDFDSRPKLESLASAMLHAKLAQDEKRKKVSKLIAGMAVVVLVSVLGLSGYRSWQDWQAQPLMQIAQTSTVGQIIQQSLPDGSKLTLNADTQIEISYFRDRRLIKLKRGEAIFEITKDPARPFIVDSETARITVLGTRFLVNRIDGEVRVAVDHGRVRFESFDAAGRVLFSPIILTNGQTAHARPGTQPAMLARPAADAFGFIEGKLVFDEASLNEVAETLSRYRKMQVKANNSGNKARVTAILKIAQIESFIRTLPKITTAEIRQTDNQTLLLEKP